MKKANQETREWTEAEHRARHQVLHRMFNELLADFISHQPWFIVSVLDKPIRELMQWSHQQTLEPKPIPGTTHATETEDESC